MAGVTAIQRSDAGRSLKGLIVRRFGDEDRALVERHRGEHMKLGFSLQLVTVRWVGMFLEDPLDVLAINRQANALYERLGFHDVTRHGENNIKIRMSSARPPEDRT